jgi:hypothetical protein
MFAAPPLLPAPLVVSYQSNSTAVAYRTASQRLTGEHVSSNSYAGALEVGPMAGLDALG